MEEEYILKVQFYNNNRIVDIFEERGESETELREMLVRLIKDSEYKIKWQIHKTVQIASGIVEVKN